MNADHFKSALSTIAGLPISEQDNMISANMRFIANAALDMAANSDNEAYEQLRNAQLALWLVGNKLRSIGLTKEDTALFNLNAAEQSIKAAIEAICGGKAEEFK